MTGAGLVGRASWSAEVSCFVGQGEGQARAPWEKGQLGGKELSRFVPAIAERGLGKAAGSKDSWGQGLFPKRQWGAIEVFE